MSNPKIPLCVGDDILLYHPSSNYTNAMTKWLIEGMCKRKKCIITLDEVVINLDHETACTSGLFGLFAEESPALIDITDATRMKKLRELTGDLIGTMKPPYYSSSLPATLRNEPLVTRIANIILWIKTWKLKADRLLVQTFNPYELPPMSALSPRCVQALEMLPEFSFVISVALQSGR
ncbi:hypothetical protein F5Y12DRAFT_711947 [Xylaria sp. FL1777]|nr:hypothetical protein F5Y12DRAFT_711947 [Xylaria sp. FL1777]